MSTMSKPTSKNPLYVQVAAFVRQQIAAGIYKPHQAIPTEFQLAKKLDVSQGTVRKGLEELAAKKVLYRQQGVGTFVADQYGDWGRYGLVNVFDKESHVIFPKHEILSVAAVHVGADINQLFNVRIGNPLMWRVLIVWRHQIHVVALEEVYLPYETLPDFNRRQLSTRLSVGDLLLKEYSVGVVEQACVIGVGGLNTEQASILKVSAEEPVLFMQMKSADSKGEMVMVQKRYILTRHYQLNLSAMPLFKI